jgi:hypothetical protein
MVRRCFDAAAGRAVADASRAAATVFTGRKAAVFAMTLVAGSLALSPLGGGAAAGSSTRVFVPVVARAALSAPDGASARTVGPTGGTVALTG